MYQTLAICLRRVCFTTKILRQYSHETSMIKRFASNYSSHKSEIMSLQQHEKAMSYLQKLINPNLSANQSRGLMEEFLWSAFQCFYHKKSFLSTDERTQAAVYFDQLLPLMENTFADIHGSMNRDKLVEAQMYLSGLKFITDDFQSDKQLTGKFDKLWQSDPVQCLVDYVENAAGSKPEYSDDPKIDLNPVPKSHFWWKFQ